MTGSGFHTNNNSKSGEVNKYQPKFDPKTQEDLDVARDAVIQIVKCCFTNFQNTDHDLARMITDRFTLREEIKTLTIIQPK